MERGINVLIEETLNEIESFLLNESNTTPVRTNKVPAKKGHDKLQPTNGDIDDFMKATKKSDIKKEECKDKKKKKPVEPDEIDAESDVLSESEDIIEEVDEALNEDLDSIKINEELEYIESFVENYSLFMED